jgi:hypothetical protein
MKNPDSKAPKHIREWYAEIGQRGGASRSAKKMAAIKENLDKARGKRWPGQLQPILPDSQSQEVPSPNLHAKIVDITAPTEC